jgi:hypothetical protein
MTNKNAKILRKRRVNIVYHFNHEGRDSFVPRKNEELSMTGEWREIELTPFWVQDKS